MEVYGVAVIPLILALIALAKGVGLPNKLAPVLSLLLGVVISVVYIYPDDLKGAILFGIMIGLSPVGLYSGTKNVKELTKPEHSKARGRTF